MQEKKFYITTAIDYVNAKPHLGHALEKVQADVLARYHRLLGESVLFLTGTDENSLKNVKAAEKVNRGVKDFVDQNARRFYELKDALNLSFDDFIRTTQERHIKGVRKLWSASKKDIYKKKYQGLYCVECEEFYRESELVNGLCPIHKIKPELVEEEDYFFRLSKYQEEIKKLIQEDKIKIIPKSRKNEVMSFINSGLEDICVSRSAKRAHNWGIDVPSDNSQKIWVWFDALSNYITALGYGESSQKFQEWWQGNENKLHVIGKGITRFHAVYWPGFLLSAKLSLPNTIFVHGYITSNGQKMSKSIGNVVDPFDLVRKYGTDAVRYFLLREIPSTEDGDFTQEKFENRYNGDLAFGLGNLVSRVLTLAAKPAYKFPSVQIADSKVQAEIDKTKRNYKQALEEFKFNEALKAIWALIGFCDKYIEEEKPWENINNKLSIINDLLLAIENIAELLKPFLPQTSEKIFNQLKARKPEPLFPRIK